MTHRALMRAMAVGALLTVLVAACGESHESSPVPSSPAPPLTVMTFNVLCSFCDLRNFDPWSERLNDFEDIFARHDPDLIGLQELSPPPLNNGMEVEQILAHAPGRAAVSFTSGPRPVP